MPRATCLALALVFAGAHAFLRAPATPLAVVTPFFSIWSPCDQLFDCWPSVCDNIVKPLHY